jgi:hypothetical protein
MTTPRCGNPGQSVTAQFAEGAAGNGDGDVHVDDKHE